MYLTIFVPFVFSVVLLLKVEYSVRVPSFPQYKQLLNTASEILNNVLFLFLGVKIKTVYEERERYSQEGE